MLFKEYISESDHFLCVCGGMSAKRPVEDETTALLTDPTTFTALLKSD